MVLLGPWEVQLYIWTTNMKITTSWNHWSNWSWQLNPQVIPNILIISLTWKPKEWRSQLKYCLIFEMLWKSNAEWHCILPSQSKHWRIKEEISFCCLINGTPITDICGMRKVGFKNQLCVDQTHTAVYLLWHWLNNTCVHNPAAVLFERISNTLITWLHPSWSNMYNALK